MLVDTEKSQAGKNGDRVAQRESKSFELNWRRE